MDGGLFYFMALRNQPYLPLYIQDVLTDEKLIECSAESHGVYFLLLCILHKQENYGLLCLKEKYKQNQSKEFEFACMLSKQMPFTEQTIHKALIELVSEKVIHIDGDTMYQKRMVKDGEISVIRSESGKKGGSNVTKQYGKSGFLYFMSDGYDKNKIGISVNPQARLYRLRSDLKLPKNFSIVDSIKVGDMGVSEDFAHKFFGKLMDGEWVQSTFQITKEKFDLLKAKLKAKSEANAEYENEIENEVDTETDNVVVKQKKQRKKFIRPTLDEIRQFAESEMMGSKELPEKFFYHYEANGWMINKVPMKNWKAAYKNWIKREQNGTYQQSIPGQQFTGETKTERDARAWEEFGKDYLEGRRTISTLFGFDENRTDAG